MISVVVLTHNDETILPKALASIAWCDEIIVVDDDSTDGTREIAKKAGAVVVLRTLGGDFAAQRNAGLAKAKGEWVLFVDSDEVVSTELAEEIQNIIAMPNANPPAGGHMLNGFYIRRKDWQFGKWLERGETSRVRLLRLARKNAGKWERSVHEVWHVQGQIGELVNPLLHYPHPDVAQFLKDINWYSSLNARYLYEHGVRAPLWQIIIYPKAKFIVNYIFHLGFLDGTAGAVVAILMSFHSFLTRAKLWVLWDKQARQLHS